MTERTRVEFTCKQDAAGTPFIVVTPVVEPLTIQEHGFIHFDLVDDITDQDALELQRLLTSKVKNICFTLNSPAADKA